MAEDNVEVEKESKKRLSSSQGDEDEPANKKRPVEVEVVDESAGGDDDDWTVDECRGDHESVEHWELRKQFLLENKGRFPNKNRLVCLSQVFANMEFLGCRYPEQTMELVHELSLGIVESYREKQKSRLQRTFVKASDAAERKTKGTSSRNIISYPPASHSTSSPLAPATPSPTPATSPQPTTNARIQMKTPPGIEDAKTVFKADIEDEQLPLYDDLRGMVLLIYAYNTGESASIIVHRSCSAANIPINVKVDGSFGNYVCTYKVGKNLAVESIDGHPTKDDAKSQAAKYMFERLQKLCFTFVTKYKIMPNLDGSEIAKDEIDGIVGVTPNQQAIPETNVGNKLLKLMGWSGGGLGKNEQGIHEAISVDGVVGRSRLGLGNDSKKSFFVKIKELLEQQKRAGFPHDLKFASDFSKEERKDIHGIAQRLKLKSKSYGKDDDRFIVISEKVSRQSLLKKTLAEGGETDKYKVIPPGGTLEGIEQYI